VSATISVPSDVAFSPAVKAVQARLGSRTKLQRMEETRGWSTRLTDDIVEFITTQTSFFLATANATGQPYIQHRGGPPGFLRVLDESTLAFADFAGNRQYITLGNLSENDRVHLFLIDYASRRRIKIWGTASVQEDPELAGELAIPGYRGKVERVLVIHVEAWDENCPQHIPQKFDAALVQQAIAERDQRIAALEAEVASLRR
jgi:predicted pyridoxine 5'-phosphate oxidase superfamily flavin-nucleotide-binding protein